MNNLTYVIDAKDWLGDAHVTLLSFKSRVTPDGLLPMTQAEFDAICKRFKFTVYRNIHGIVMNRLWGARITIVSELHDIKQSERPFWLSTPTPTP